MLRDQTNADPCACEKVPVRQGMCAAAGGNPADAKPIGGNRAAEFGGYFRDRRANSRIAEMHRERKAGEAIVGGRDLAGSYDDREELAVDDEPGMTIDEAIAVFLGSLGLMRDASEGDRRATLAAG
ncbi:hypothetical protein [Aureimonas glaciei]|uniref:Uncharacterized protein n=1 Tax=Aureimonas glaciei TaxID=1776957 RepID=A0A916YG31_9HYPH|nr:hypothetical protein [Aureimonas glaciei]GGD43160.1 hypothetical protein GCM10011335_52300 [Aureimonas glaciei]